MLDEPSNILAWFEISVDEGILGRVYFELFDQLCPMTCQNFKGLCTGQYGQTPSGTDLYYKGTSFFRVIPNFIIQGGDISRQGDGTGGQSIWSRYFKDESFLISHASSGLLSMVNEGPDTNQSQFFITCAPCPWLDGRNVVFGRVISGYDVLARIEACGSPSGAVQDTSIRITDCGLSDRKEIPKEKYQAAPLRSTDPITGIGKEGHVPRGAIKLNFDKLRENARPENARPENARGDNIRLENIRPENIKKSDNK